MNKIISDYFLNDSTLKLFYTARNSANINPITIISATENIINESIPLPIKTSRAVHPIFLTCFIVLKVLIGYIMYKNIQTEKQSPPSVKERSKEFFKKYGPVFLALSTLGTISYFTYRQFFIETIDKVTQNNISKEPFCKVNRPFTLEHIFQDLTDISKNSKKNFSASKIPPDKLPLIQDLVQNIDVSTPATTNPLLNETSTEIPLISDENPFINKTTGIQPNITENIDVSIPATTNPLLNETSIEIPPVNLETQNSAGITNNSLKADIPLGTNHTVSNTTHHNAPSTLNDTFGIQQVTETANKSNEENLNTTDILKPDPDIDQKPPKPDIASNEKNTRNSNTLDVTKKVTQTNPQETIRTIGSIFDLFTLASTAFAISSIFIATKICDRKKIRERLNSGHTVSQTESSVNRLSLEVNEQVRNPDDTSASDINNPADNSPQDKAFSSSKSEINLERKLAASEQTITELNKALSDNKRKHDKVISDLKKDFDETQKAKEQIIKALNKALHDNKQEYEKELEKVKERETLLKTTIETLESQNGNFQTEVADLKDSQIIRIEDALKIPRREIKKLTEKLSQTTQENILLHENNEALRERIRDLLKENEELRAQRKSESPKLSQSRNSKGPDDDSKPTYEQLEDHCNKQAEKIKRLEEKNFKSHRNGQSISFSPSAEIINVTPTDEDRNHDLIVLKQEIRGLEDENKLLRKRFDQHNLTALLGSYYDKLPPSPSAPSEFDTELFDLVQEKRRLKKENKFLENMLAEREVPDDLFTADHSHNDGTYDDDEASNLPQPQSGRYPRRARKPRRVRRSKSTPDFFSSSSDSDV